MELESKYDIGIIGSGLGRLGEGIMLTKQNSDMKVLIIEQHTIPGGHVIGFYRKGYYFDLGARMVQLLKEAVPSLRYRRVLK